MARSASPGSIESGKSHVTINTVDGDFYSGMRSAENRLKAFSAAALKIATPLAAIGGAAVAAFTPAVRIFAEFEDQMSAVRAVTGATAADFERLKDTARELGATTTFSASAAAQGMKFLGMAGYNTEQILAGIPAVLDLAKAGAVELGVAADIASDVSSAFGLTADEIRRVADVMAKAASSSNVSIETLGEAFQFAAPAGAAAGQTIEEVSAALGTLGNSGLKGSMAGRNLAIIFKQLADSDIQKQLSAIGVSVQNAKGEFLDLHDIVRQLKGPMAAMTEVERVNFLTEAFGEASKAAQILVTSTAGFDDLKTKLDGAAGSAAAMAEIMADNLGGDWQALKSAIEETALALITELNPSLRDTTQDVTEIVRAVGEWIKNNGETVVTLTKIAAGAGAVGGSLLALAATAQGLSMAVGALNTVMALNPVFAGLAIGGAAAAALVLIAKNARDATDAVKGLNDAMSNTDIRAQISDLQRNNSLAGQSPERIAANNRRIAQLRDQLGANGPEQITGTDGGAGTDPRDELRKRFPKWDSYSQATKHRLAAQFRREQAANAADDTAASPASDPLESLINATRKAGPGKINPSKPNPKSLTGIFGGLHQQISNIGQPAGNISGLLAAPDIIRDAMQRATQAAAAGTETTKHSVAQINQAKATDASSAEAQKAIAAAMAPRATYETKMAKHAEETAEAVKQTASWLDDMRNFAQSAPIIFAGNES